MMVICRKTGQYYDPEIRFKETITQQWFIERIEELECLDTLNEEETAELAALKAFVFEYDYVDDWKYGAQFIAEEYFTEYVKDMLIDCGTIPRDLPDYIAIDWEETADNLKVDYVDAEFAGVAYYVRSV